MENFVYVVIAFVIGLIIVIAINRSRKSPHPISLDEEKAHQKKVFENYLNMDSGLKDIFQKALQDGATHMKHAPRLDSTDTFSPDETIAFYRVHGGIYEKRYFFLHERTFTKGAKWGLNWLQCEELPQDAIPIPE